MAFVFVGASNNNLRIGPGANIYVTPPFSVSVDCMLLATTGVVFSQLASANQFNGHYLGFSSNSIAAISASNNSFAISGTRPVNLFSRTIITGTWASTTSRQVFVNGVPGTIETTSKIPAVTPNTALVGAANHDNSIDNGASMRVFSAFVWRAPLLTADNQLLAQGLPPHLLRPTDIVDGFYFREPIGGLRSITKARTFTNNSVTFSPDMIRPKVYKPQRFAFPAPLATVLMSRARSPLGTRIASRQTVNG